MDDGAVATRELNFETSCGPTTAVPVEVTPTEPAPGVIAPAPGTYDFIYMTWKEGPLLALGSLDGTATALRRLDGGVGASGQIAVSPKGDRVAYVTYDAEVFEWDLRVLSLRDLSDRHITFVSSVAVRPAWSPDGAALAYVSRTPINNDSGVYVVPADGGDPKLLDEIVWGSEQFIAPHWSPSGTEIVYSARDEIRVVDVGEGTVRQLVKPESDRLFAEPRWSPSGDAVAYAWYDPTFPSRGAIARVAQDGGTPVDLAPAFGGLGFGRVRWSPCGDAIVYVDYDYDASAAAIRRVDADGSNPMILDHLDSGLGDGAGQPEWSPDGAWILYVRFESGAALNLIDATGGARRSLGIEGASIDATYPSWFPAPLVVTEARTN